MTYHEHSDEYEKRKKEAHREIVRIAVIFVALTSLFSLPLFLNSHPTFTTNGILVHTTNHSLIIFLALWIFVVVFFFFALRKNKFQKYNLRNIGS